MSVRLVSIPATDDALFLEDVISREKNQELKDALQDLDEYLFW